MNFKKPPETIKIYWFLVELLSFFNFGWILVQQTSNYEFLKSPNVVFTLIIRWNLYLSSILISFQMTTSYICDYKGNVICQSGWKQSSDPQEAKSNPCSVPICNHDNETCAHGICRAPNFCACEVGWEGISCDVCIPLPGCVHGNCTMELECNCYEGWTGSKCDIRKLKIIIFNPLLVITSLAVHVLL